MPVPPLRRLRQEARLSPGVLHLLQNKLKTKFLKSFLIDPHETLKKGVKT
jgi:hypothetical protein